MQKRILKKIVVIVSCGVAVSAHAMGNGFYMGVMMGPATSNAPSLQAIKAPAPFENAPLGVNQNPLETTIANPRSNIFATRIYLGNQFNPYAGIEFGGTFYSAIRYDSRDVPTVGSTSQRVRDLDLVLKGIFPISAFSLYGKIGMAAIYLTSGGAFNPVFEPATPTTNSKFSASTTYKHKFAPTFSMSASYDINQAGK